MLCVIIFITIYINIAVALSSDLYKYLSVNKGVQGYIGSHIYSSTTRVCYIRYCAINNPDNCVIPYTTVDFDKVQTSTDNIFAYFGYKLLSTGLASITSVNGVVSRCVSYDDRVYSL